MAAMAPALTEAATQAKIKLPETSSSASSDSLNRRNIIKIAKKEGQTKVAREKIIKTVKPHGTAVQHQIQSSNLATKPTQHNTACTQQSALIPQHIPLKLAGNNSVVNLDLTPTNKHSSFQNEFLKTIKQLYGTKLGKVPQIMNRPSTGQDKEEKCVGQTTKIGSHVQQRQSQVEGSTLVGNSRGVSQTCRKTNPPHRVPQYQDNMCRKSEGCSTTKTPNPNTHLSAGSSPQDSQSGGTRKNTTVSPGQSTFFISSPLSSPDSVCEKETVDDHVRSGLNETSKKQAQLERRIEFLQRRLRRIQARQVEHHVQGQLDAFVSHQHQNLQTVARTLNPSQENSCDLKKELFSDGVKHMSTKALVTLVQKIQSTNSFQPQPQPPPVQEEVTSVLRISDDVRKQSRAAAEKLTMNIGFLQSSLDSDATESSSGGESGEENVTEDAQPSVPSTPLVRRAEWKWCFERSAIASRWTWLQAQVSDLEYRIRQQSEVYRQARVNKGDVVLGEPPAPPDFLHGSSQPTVSAGSESRTGLQHVTTTGTEVSPLPVSALLSNVDKQASRLTQSLGNCLSPANTSPASSVSSCYPKSNVSSPVPGPNGLIGSPSVSTTSVDVEGGSPPRLLVDSHLADPVDLSPILDPTCRAARCLPLKQPLRKRRLLRISGLHLKSAKAAKLSSVKCHCYGPVTCVLCSGRLNSLQTVDPTSMPYQERVALLDHSYHQVLSFHEEVPLSVRFEGLLRSGDWKDKPTVRQPRASASPKCQKSQPKVMDGRKKPFRKSASSVISILQSVKIRNKYEQKTGRKPGPPRGKKLAKRALNAELKKRRKNVYSIDPDWKKKNCKGTSDYPGSTLDTLAASPVSRDAGGQKEKEARKRRGESAYDINNIVIPHSMASLTRVERLEYKEIPIPSWRDLSKETDLERAASSDNGDDVKSNGGQSDVKQETDDKEEVEDLSDECYILRHQRCEVAERKHFSTFLKLPPSRRNRSNPHLFHPDPSQPLTPNLPVSMGTQASLDGGEDDGEDSLDLTVRRGSVSLPQTPRCSTPVPHFTLSEDDNSISHLSAGGMVCESRRGSLSAGHRERLSLGSSMEDTEWDKAPVIKPWPPRVFPLSEEEVKQLEVKDTVVSEKRRHNLRAVSSMTSLRPHPVDGGSQGGSSMSGSLPPSPMPSTSSASAAGDLDATDPEWMEEMIRKKSSQHKSVKR